jgi:hypothetical protein
MSKADKLLVWLHGEIKTPPFSVQGLHISVIFAAATQ